MIVDAIKRNVFRTKPQKIIVNCCISRATAALYGLLMITRNSIHASEKLQKMLVSTRPLWGNKIEGEAEAGRKLPPYLLGSFGGRRTFLGWNLLPADNVVIKGR